MLYRAGKKIDFSINHFFNEVDSISTLKSRESIFPVLISARI